MMQLVMFGRRDEFKILESVIKRISVDMVNVLISAKRSVKMLHHYPSMFFNRLFSDTDRFVIHLFPFRVKLSIPFHLFVFTRSAIAPTFRLCFMAATTRMFSFNHVTRNIIYA